MSSAVLGLWQVWSVTASSGGDEAMVNKKLAKKLKENQEKSDDLKEALKTPITFPGA